MMGVVAPVQALKKDVNTWACGRAGEIIIAQRGYGGVTSRMVRLVQFRPHTERLIVRSIWQFEVRLVP